MEVTSRGGFKKVPFIFFVFSWKFTCYRLCQLFSYLGQAELQVVEEKKWKEVTNCFTFPPSATNASFIIRKYYMTLIHHFEQVYYLKAKTFTPAPTGTCIIYYYMPKLRLFNNLFLQIIGRVQMQPSLQSQK